MIHVDGPVCPQGEDGGGHQNAVVVKAADGSAVQVRQAGGDAVVVRLRNPAEGADHRACTRNPVALLQPQSVRAIDVRFSPAQAGAGGQRRNQIRDLRGVNLTAVQVSATASQGVPLPEEIGPKGTQDLAARAVPLCGFGIEPRQADIPAQRACRQEKHGLRPVALGLCLKRLVVLIAGDDKAVCLFFYVDPGRFQRVDGKVDIRGGFKLACDRQPTVPVQEGERK